MRKLFFVFVCLGCVANLSAMSTVKRFCSCVSEKVAPFVPQSGWGKMIEGGLFIGAVYGLWKAAAHEKQMEELSHISAGNAESPFNGRVNEYEIQIFTLSQALQERNQTIEDQKLTIGKQAETINDLSQTIENLRNGESTLVEFDNGDNDTSIRNEHVPAAQSAYPMASNDNNNGNLKRDSLTRLDNDIDTIPVKNRSVPLPPPTSPITSGKNRNVPPPPASPMTLDDNSSIDLNSSLNVSSISISEIEEMINLEANGYRYIGQGLRRTPRGKGEIILASSSLKIGGFFQDGQLVINDEHLIYFVWQSKPYNFEVSENCRPIVFNLEDFDGIKVERFKAQSNYLLLLTNKNGDNFIFRPAYFYKGQVSNASHLPEGNGLMVMTKDGSILRGIFKRENLVKAIDEESQQQEPLVQEE